LHSQQAKGYAALGLAALCFAALYPRLLQPLLLAAMGRRDEAKQAAEAAMAHPRDRLRPAAALLDTVDADDAQRMASAAEAAAAAVANGGRPQPVFHPPMHQQQQHHHHHQQRHQQLQQASGLHSNSLVTVVLPLYSVAILGFLLYTLMRMAGGSGGVSSGINRQFSPEWRRQQQRLLASLVARQQQQALDGNGDVSGHSNGSAGENGGESLSLAAIERDLQKLLGRLDNGGSDNGNREQLKLQLARTEAEMVRLLEGIRQAQ
ncbi:hypothetical protein BOX15_Mlig009353g2, partial [Macrostomum lignano]